MTTIDGGYQFALRAAANRLHAVGGLRRVQHSVADRRECRRGARTPDHRPSHCRPERSVHHTRRCSVHRAV